MYGIEEQPSTLKSSERKLRDHRRVIEFFNYLDITDNVSINEDGYCHRLGKFDVNDARPRLIKIRLRHIDDIKFVFRAIKSKKVPIDEDARFKSIRVYSDRTLRQMQYLKQITSDLAAREGNGESNLSINFVNNACI